MSARPAILVCGSRGWTDKDAIRRHLDHRIRQVPRLVILTGRAPGADTIADEIAEEMGADRLQAPANWRARGKGAGMIRNRFMLDVLDAFEPRFVMAFRLDGESPGTDGCVAEARRRGFLVEMHEATP